MRRAGLRTVTGHITILQEERFRLVTDDGRVLLLTLAHNAGVGAEELHHFRQSGTRLCVEYEGEPDLASGVARSVKLTLRQHVIQE
jgi:hypothetical protein